MTTTNRRIFKIFPLLILMMLFIDCCILQFVGKQKVQSKMQAATIQGQHVINEIQLCLDNILETTEAIKYLYLLYGEDCFEEFDDFAAYIMADTPEISSIYIAPEGIIQVAYPAEVNESTIGFEMLKDPAQGPKAQLAIDTKKVTIAGPHNLVEGGIGFILRNPVFKDDQFLGFTIIVLNVRQFASHILSQLSTSEEQYKYGVWIDVQDTTAVYTDNGFILRNTREPVSDKVDIEFNVPNDIWHLVIEPVEGWLTPSDLLMTTITLVLFTLIGLIAMYFIFYAWDRKRLAEREELELRAQNQYMAQLSEALEQAKNASEAKTRFLSNMSHDIRTPMNAIIGFTNLMEKEINNPEKLQDYIAKVQQSGQFLLTIINNILDITRIDSGKFEVDEVLTDLMNPSCNIVPLVEADIHRKNLHFTCHMDIQHQYVFCDMEKIKQVNMNLISNAIKYTPEGGSISLDFREYPSDKPGYAKYINTWSDTGVGMSPEYLETIFEPFSREKNSTESKVIGTGLGMSIVKKLVDLMGGTIEIESELGKGSTFRVIMDHRIADPADVQILKQKEVQIENVSFEHAHILLAEDNALNAEIAVTVLEDLGCTVDVAEDGVQCIDKLRTTAIGFYDFILMDIQMPNLNGYETTEKIRRAGLEIPIIAMTANAFEEDKKRALEAGMNGHIAKPIDVAELIKVLSGVVNKDRKES